MRSHMNPAFFEKNKSTFIMLSVQNQRAEDLGLPTTLTYYLLE